MADNKRSDGIDYAKGIGILLVVLGHMQLLGCGETFRTLTNIIYSFHMPLFFFVSGLTLEKKYLSRTPCRSDIKKLAKRLLIPYFSWSAVYILLKCVIAGEGILRIIKRNSAAVLTFRGIAPLWFLSALFMAEVLVILLVYKLGMNKLYLLAFSGSMTIALGSAVQVFYGVFRYYVRLPIIAFYRLFPCIFFVTLGCVMSGTFTCARTENLRRKSALLAVSAAVFAAVNILLPSAANLYKMKFDNTAAFIITGMAGSIMIVSLCTLLPENILPLKFLGRNSMLIMVLHYPPVPTIALAEMLALSLRFEGYSCAAFVFLMTVTVTSAVCILYSFFAELIKRRPRMLRKPVSPAKSVRT